MIEKKIEEYLNSKNCVLWGRSFSLHDKKDIKRAKEWLLDLIIDLGLTEEKEESNERPNWDDYFLSICKVVAARADCRRAKHGCVIVKDHRIVSTGYNGSPSGGASCLAGECPRGLLSDEQCRSLSSYENCFALHAEQNAIAYADRTDTRGATLYVTGIQCDMCRKLSRAAGITRVVWPGGEEIFKC